MCHQGLWNFFGSWYTAMRITGMLIIIAHRISAVFCHAFPFGSRSREQESGGEDDPRLPYLMLEQWKQAPTPYVELRSLTPIL